MPPTKLTPELLDALDRLTKAINAIQAEQARRNAVAIEGFAAALERSLAASRDGEATR